MNKKLIRLTESDLHRIVEDTINEILDDPYDFAKAKGLSAAAYSAAKTPGADQKWADRKMRQSNVINDRAKNLSREYSKSEGNDPHVKWAMAGAGAHRVEQGMDDPKGYIRRNGYNNYLKGMKESYLRKVVKESIDSVLNEVQWTDSYGTAHSTHGNNSEDWHAIANERGTRANRTIPSNNSIVSDNVYNKYKKNKGAEMRNRGNAN